MANNSTPIPGVYQGSKHHSSTIKHGQAADEKRAARLAAAQAAGLTGDFANQYANASRKNTYRDTFWDRVRKFFGGKLGSEEMQELLDQEDQTLLTELLNAQREQENNSPEAQIARLRAAGLNPDLTGGESITPGEASQIDDETLGSALSPGLSAVQQSAIDLPVQVANTIMDAAGSVMTLISSGMNVGFALQNQDFKEMESLFSFSKQMNDLGSFLPLIGIGFDDVSNQFYDDNGNLTLELMSDKVKNELYKQRANYRHPRSRKIFDNLFQNFFSSKSLESYYNSKAGQRKAIQSALEADTEASKLAGFDVKGLNYGQVVDSPALNETREFAISLYKLSLQSAKELAQYQTDYWSNLNETDGEGYTAADYESSSKWLQITSEQLQNAIKSQVYDMTLKWLQDMQDSDDPLAVPLTYSLMSGSFKQLGFESPFDLYEKGIDKLGSIVDWITDLIPTKALAKGAVKGAKAVTKATSKGKK